MLYAISFLTGILLFSLKTDFLISNNEIILLATLCIFALISIKTFSKFSKFSISIIFLIAGYFWSFLYSSDVFNHNVPQNYHNTYVVTTGTIASLVEHNKYRDRFIFNTSEPFVSKLRVSFYDKHRPTLAAGQQWKLTLKIKTNNSYSNIGSFDYEKWLFVNTINATGYTNTKKYHTLITQTSDNIGNQIREKVKHKLQKITKDLEFSGIINALLIGDKSSVANTHKKILQRTGTSHLSVISGLHLGIIASSIFLLFTFIFSRIPRIINFIPIIIPVAIITIIATFLYMALAGFSTPTIRAFIMIATFMLAIIFKLNIFKWQIYFLALFITLLFNPIAVLEVGFWLSFIASGIIIYFINFNSSAISLTQKIVQVIYLQIFITIIMSPIIVWFFGEFSLISPLANIVLIPIFSIIIVPLSFVGLLVSLFFSDISHSIFSSIDSILHYCFMFLEYISNITPSVNIAYFDNFQLSAMLIAVIFLLLHTKLFLKPLSILISIVVVLTPQTPNNHLYVLDVGQGSANVFAVDNQAIIIDTGNKFRTGFNLGDAVIIPFLRAKNITDIQSLIITHSDMDHRGGADAIRDAYTIDTQITPYNHQCIEGVRWDFQGWKFEILSGGNTFKTTNNNSCVLQAQKNNKKILFTGDIEKQAERYLITKYGKKLQSDILIAPHHGSKTSSSKEFLQAVRPNIAIFSAGFQNAFKHPAKEIVKRYHNLGIKTYGTMCSGEIAVNLDDFSITEYRKNMRKFYHRKCE